MYLNQLYYKFIPIFSMLIFIYGLSVKTIQAMDMDRLPAQESVNCPYCTQKIVWKGFRLPFEALREPTANSINLKDMDRKHIAKKQKISDVKVINKYEAETTEIAQNFNALENSFEIPTGANRESIKRWEKITKAYPNLKNDIFTFYKDLIQLNPEKYTEMICCLGLVDTLLISSYGYLIMQALEDQYYWAEYTKLPDSLGSLTWITSLSFYEGSIMDKTLVGYGYVSEGDDDPFLHNKHHKIPPAITQLTNLESLSVGLNQISKLPNGITNLIKLQKLRIWDNSIKSLPEGFGKLTALTDLTLYNHELTMLPDEIGKLTRLEKLYIIQDSQSDLKALPASMANLTNLRHLVWNASNASFLPTSFGKFLTRKERKYEFKSYPLFSNEWVKECETEADTIYIKPRVSANPFTLSCQYLVGAPEGENGHYRGQFEIYAQDLISPVTLQQKALNELSKHSYSLLAEIRCDKFCGWEGDSPIDCDILDEDEDIDGEHGGPQYCGLDYGPYKSMLADCYIRYHTHLLVRCLMNEFGNAFDLYIPRDVMYSIARILHALEERVLYSRIINPMIDQFYKYANKATILLNNNDNGRNDDKLYDTQRDMWEINHKLMKYYAPYYFYAPYHY